MAIRRDRPGQPPEQTGQKRTAGRDAPPAIDDQLARLEEDVRRLKVEFDIYFNGGAKRPPYDTKSRVETIIKRIGDERNLTYAQRYHYNTVVSRYNAFRDLWRRTVQEREEGRTHVPLRQSATQMAAPREPAPAAQKSFICTDARAEVPTVKHLYDALVAARRECGEEAENVPFSQFHRLLAVNTESLKERLGCERVRYTVTIEGGRVGLKAKGEKD